MQLTQNPTFEADVNIIHPDTDQPRHQCKQSTINEIAASAKINGILNPITLRKHPEIKGEWLIVHGETRWRAASKLQLATIPARMATTDEIGDSMSRLMLQATDNISAPLSHLDWGHLYNTLTKSYDLNAKNIEKLMLENGLRKHGVSAIKNLIRITQDSPEWIIKLIECDALTPSHAKIMLNVDTDILNTLKIWMVNNHRPTIKALEDEVLALHQENHTPLYDPLNLMGCTGCLKKKSVIKKIFCLNKECFDKKNNDLDAEPENNTTNEWPDGENETEDATAEPQTTITTHTITEHTAPPEKNEDQDEMFEEINALNTNTFCLAGCEQCPSKISISGEGERNHCNAPACWDDKCDAAIDLKILVTKWIIKQLENHFEHASIDVTNFLNWNLLGCPITKKGLITHRHHLTPPFTFELISNITLATMPATAWAKHAIAIALIQDLSRWKSFPTIADIGRELVKTYDINPHATPIEVSIGDLPVNTGLTEIMWAWDQLNSTAQ